MNTTPAGPTGPNPILVQTTRGEFVEATHAVFASVWKDGAVAHTAGPPDAAFLLRSSAKPVQALAAILTGAADRFAMTDAELSLACGSHSGEAHHVETAAGLLHRVGLSAAHLRCGAHRPIYQPAADDLVRSPETEGPLHNNCSGKHAAMLAACVAAGWDVATYDAPDHPLQRMNRANTARLAGMPEESVGAATDGCSVPTFHVPLSAAARTFAHLTAAGSAGLPDDVTAGCERLVAAVAARPEMIGGTGRVDTDLPRATDGRLIAKVGAEGLWCIGAHGAGIGLALKSTTGVGSATYHAGLHLLRALDLLSTAEWSALAEHHDPVRRNHRRLDIGRVVVTGVADVARAS